MTEFIGGPDLVEEYRRIPLAWYRPSPINEAEFITLLDPEGDAYEITPLALEQLLTEAGFTPRDDLDDGGQDDGGQDDGGQVDRSRKRLNEPVPTDEEGVTPDGEPEVEQPADRPGDAPNLIH